MGEIFQYIEVKENIIWSPFPKPLVFIDLETIDGRAQKDSIIEIAAIRIDPNQNRGKCLSTLLNVPNVGTLQKVHSITQQDVEDAPTFEQIAPYLIEILDGACIVAHQANFEDRFLRAELQNLGCTYNNPYFCTLKFSRKLHPNKKTKGDHKLGGIMNFYNIPSSGTAHFALSDVYDLIKITEKLLEDANNQEKLSTLVAECTKQYPNPSIWSKMTPQSITVKNRGATEQIIIPPQIPQKIQKEEITKEEITKEEITKEEITKEESLIQHKLFIIILCIALAFGLFAGMMM